MRPVGEDGVVGRFRVLGELGRGGMGRVLLASAPDGRLVAVKQVHPHFVADEGFRERFRREVRASRRVSGAYTAAVVGADTEAEVPWLASVFVQGPSLRDVITKTGGLPEDAVLRLAAGLATALAEIHSVGLVHRDLKPANVLLAGDGPRVIDFGIARAMDGSTFTHEGTVIGSPTYMSPEQAEGGPVTPASDMFSLGSLLVAAATGHDAFGGDSELAIRRSVRYANPDLSGLPTGLRKIVLWCLAKDPGGRPSPDLLIDAIGDLAPTLRPWPQDVYDMTAAQSADIADRVAHPVPEDDTLLQATWPEPAPETQVTAAKTSWLGDTYRSIRDTGLVLAGLTAGAVVVARVTDGRPVPVPDGMLTLLPGAQPAFVGLGAAVVLGLVLYAVSGIESRVLYSVFSILPLGGLVIGLLDIPVTVVGVDYGHVPALVLLAAVIGGTGLVAVVAAVRRNRYAVSVLLTLVTLVTGYVTSLTGYLGLTGITIGQVTVEFGTLLGAVIGAGIAVRVVTWMRTDPR